MSSDLAHAMDLASMHDWDASKALLEGMDDPIAGRFFLLVCDLEQEERRRANHMAMIRHEIGNALTMAQVNMEGIVDGVLPATPERLNGILVSLSSAGTMLEDLKRLPAAVPFGDVIRIETFNVCSLIAAHAAAIAGLAAAKNVRVIYEPCGKRVGSCESFRGNASRIGQILRNVLINAVRFTPPGGSVDIQCAETGSDLALTIKDSGSGIASEDVPHIFKAGYRGKDVHVPGSGIGLSVVEKLLKSLGGNARLLESAGTGAAFIITLPTIPLSPRPEITASSEP